MLEPRNFIAVSYGLSWFTLGAVTYAVAAVLKWRRKRKISAASRGSQTRRG